AAGDRMRKRLSDHGLPQDLDARIGRRGLRLPAMRAQDRGARGQQIARHVVTSQVPDRATDARSALATSPRRLRDDPSHDLQGAVVELHAGWTREGQLVVRLDRDVHRLDLAVLLGLDLHIGALDPDVAVAALDRDGTAALDGEVAVDLHGERVLLRI